MLYTNAESVYALSLLGLHPGPVVLGSERVHSSPFSGTGNSVSAFWVKLLISIGVSEVVCIDNTVQYKQPQCQRNISLQCLKKLAET